ncbi:MAG: hypothetical protein U0736_03625 [Gemmataceae bacterium]
MAANLLAFNFVLYDVLAGGASCRCTDNQGKTLARPAPPGRPAAGKRRGDAPGFGESASELVLYEVRDRTAVLTPNRPDRRNALDKR